MDTAHSIALECPMTLPENLELIVERFSSSPVFVWKIKISVSRHITLSSKSKK